MERFAEALKGLDITDQRTREKISPLLSAFLTAAQRLQRVLTPLDSSVHGAVSRSTTKRDSPVTSVYWISVYDRVGLFDVDDSDVARLVVAALRYVWRKEAADALIAAVGREGDRILAHSRRLQDGVGEAEGDIVDVAGTAGHAGLPPLRMMTLPALRAHCVFSLVRPPICIPNSSALSSAKAVSAAVAKSPNPASLCRSIAFRDCTALQTFLIARAGLTEANLAGEIDVAPGDGGDTAVAVDLTGQAAGSPHGGGVSESVGGADDVAAGHTGRTMASGPVGGAADGDTEGADGGSVKVVGDDEGGESRGEASGKVRAEAGSDEGRQSGREASFAACGDAGGDAGGQLGGNTGGDVGSGAGSDACSGAGRDVGIRVGLESDGGADGKVCGKEVGTAASRSSAAAIGGAASATAGETSVGADGLVACDDVGTAASRAPSRAPSGIAGEVAGVTGDGAAGDAATGATTAVAGVAATTTPGVPPAGSGSGADGNAALSVAAVQDSAADTAATPRADTDESPAAGNSGDAKDAGTLADTNADQT